MTNWFMSYMPLQASEHAEQIDQMTRLTHWLMLVLFVGWGAYFLFALVRFRSGANTRADYAGAKGKVAKGSEVLVAIIEIVLLIAYAIPAWAMRVRPMPADPRAVIVRVVGEQFAWNVHYPGKDGKFGRTDPKLVSADNPLGLDRNDADAKDDITELNQLTVPKDRPVLVHLVSKDVIHSFGLYEMRIKQDAIPGMEIPVWFVPTRAGDYEITCSQLCGLGHYRMRGFITVQSQSDFDKWLADQAKELTQ